MSSLAQRIYVSLPPFARNWAAGLRGYAFYRQRYGPQTVRLAAETLERDHWDRARWNAWLAGRTSQVLRSAATAPHYQRTLPAPSPTGLDAWPILEKDHIRAAPKDLLVPGANPKRLTSVPTSGTTGKPLQLWRDEFTSQTWYALIEARMKNWFGVTYRHRWANVGGQLVTPVARRRPPFWVWNRPMRQLYMSSYHLAPDLIAHYLDALERYEISYIHGYTSSLYALALHTPPGRGRSLGLRVALTNAEPLEEYQRQAIHNAFGCPVVATYGMAEAVAGASECEHGGLHLWPEAGIVQIDPLTMDPNGVGDYLCTGLLNLAMPLVRYRIGDRGRPPVWDHDCPCGRSIPLLPPLEGRADEVLLTPDGRRIGRLDPVFKADLPLVEAQIAQTARDTVEVRYVPAPGLSPQHLATIGQRLRERMGQVQVNFLQIDQIPRGPNGKFRAVVCEIPPSQLASKSPAS